MRADPTELAEALATIADTLAEHIATRREHLIGQGLDPELAVDPHGRSILLDAYAAHGQVVAAAAQLVAATTPLPPVERTSPGPALVDDLRDLVARARNRETAPPAIALVDDVEAILDEHAARTGR